MAKTQNSVQLIGYLGGDPVLRRSVTGSPYTRVPTQHASIPHLQGGR